MEKQKLNISTFLIIFWVLLAGQFVFFLIANVIVYTNQITISDEADKYMGIIVPVVVAGSVLAGLLLNFLSARKLRNLTDANEKFKRFTSNNIIGWAFIEGSVLMNIIAFIITSHHFYQVAATLMMLFFLITIPTTSRIAFALNLDENAINILKQ